MDCKRLREWFKMNAAKLPWRLSDLDTPRDPYAVWISETMLQQTQVSTVRDYFTRWMKRFPDVATLAKASEEEVFKYWQGLGYYSRARNILKTAKILAERKEFPRTRKELEALPGIGAYTAGAILSLAYHQHEAILDGNLVRIFSRLFTLDFLPTDSKDALKTYWDYARETADSPKAYMHNEALMELGRTVCKIKNPDCANCPLQGVCKAFAESRTAEFPSPRNATVGLPAQAEDYINADQVSGVQNIGKFKHNITVHKIECDVLHIKLREKAPTRKASANSAHEIQWVKCDLAQEFFANSFCLKALALLR